jgi:nucleoside 2-deoxyribosyltransferase
MDGCATVKLFVCGPITHALRADGFDPEVRSLVETVTHALSTRGYHLLSAHHLENFGASIPADAREVFVRDWQLAQQADAMIFLFPSDDEGRLIRTDGTFMELGWASALGKPLFVLADPDSTGRSYLFDGLLSACVQRALIDLREPGAVAALERALADEFGGVAASAPALAATTVAISA